MTLCKSCNPHSAATPDRAIDFAHINAANDQVQTAPAAFKRLRTPFGDLARLEERFHSLLIAAWAKPMRWLRVTLRLLLSIGKTPVPSVGKFVLLCFCRPVFECHNALFKLSLLSFERRQFLLARRYRFISGEEMPLQVQFHIKHGASSFNTFEGLNEIARSVEAAQRGAESLKDHNRSRIAELSAELDAAQNESIHPDTQVAGA